MLPHPSCRRWAPLLLAIITSPVSASEAAKLLPAETDMIVTLNVRQLLEDHKKSEAVQHFLEPWRLAVKGDENALRQYYQTRDLGNKAGITEKDFLSQAQTLRSFSESLGLDPVEDIDRITGASRAKEPTAWVVIVEGRFSEERLRIAVRQLAQQHVGSFKAVRMGAVEVWQVPGEGDGVRLALLNARTLAITGRQKGMDELLARTSGAKKDELSAGVRALIDKAEKEHVAFLVDHVDTLLGDAAKTAIDDASRSLNLKDNPIAQMALTRFNAWLVADGKDITCASIALSIGEDELRLQFGMGIRTAEKAKELVTGIGRGTLTVALATKAIDKKLVRQLGDMLLRVSAKSQETMVTVQAQIPYELIQEIVNESQAALNPMVEKVSRQVTSIPIWGPPKPPPGALEVIEMRDVAYRDDAKADPIRHRMDLFLPRGKKGYPVVVFVHGGGWVIGDNRCCGLYSSVGQFLASQGIGVVLPNYRLSPSVMHPEHVRDVARAVRWTKDHIAEHGGNPDRLYLMGHSAGGHLVSLLATDESYLKAEDMSPRDIKGVIAIGGVYHIPPGAQEVFVGGTGTRSFRPDEIFPLRGDAMVPFLPPLALSVPVSMFSRAFGDDAKGRTDASPVSHVHRGLPPFLILVSTQDLPSLADMAEEFHKALLRDGCDSRLMKVEKRNHNSLIFSAISPDDPAGRAMLEFVR
jgi:acetyl esterase/lipase